MYTNNYKLEKGDTVRITGCRGRLFSGHGAERKLADGIELGVECVLITGEDDDLEIQLPKGILADGKQYIHMACAELVKKSEYKFAIITHDPNCKIFEVRDGANEHFMAKIQYEYIPKEVAEVCADFIKEAYNASALNNPPPRDLRKLL